MFANRGRRYIDGSVQDAIKGDHSNLLKDNGRAFVMDYHQVSFLLNSTIPCKAFTVKLLRSKKGTSFMQMHFVVGYPPDRKRSCADAGMLTLFPLFAG